ncbi:MAG: glycoside hydrolase clan [Rariglobus sp.]|nr:glycoside hydrolase clan [Rariglobus sp.]
MPDILTPPDAVYILTQNDSRPQRAQRGQTGWEHGSVRVDITPLDDRCAAVTVTTVVPLLRVVLRWNGHFPPGTRLLGDAWERSYGDLEWRGATPHRLMPWYFLAHHGDRTTGYGVQTGGAAFAGWQADSSGLTLNLDLRSGGVGVSPGTRPLSAAVLVQRAAHSGESPFAAARAFCAALSPVHLTPRLPVVGHNDWYWLYGKNSEALILEATRRFVDLYPKNTDVRPWSVIDDGWQVPAAPGDPWCNGGPWNQGNHLFPDMPGLASKIKALGARPGIWMRPLQTKAAIPDAWKIRCPKPNSTEGGFVMDPTVPEVIDLIRTDIARIRDWG